MSDLLETVEAHGGLPRWTELETVSARLVQGGALWGLKGQDGVLDDLDATAIHLTDDQYAELRDAVS